METTILAFEVSLVILLLFSLFSMIQLRRKIKSFQALQGGLQKDLQSFSDATEKAQGVFSSLQKAMNDYQTILGNDRKGAEELRQDLLYLVEQGKMAADKLEVSLHELRPPSDNKSPDNKKARPAPKDGKSREAFLKSIENLR